MNKLFGLFLDGIKSNMKQKGKSDEQIVRVLTDINSRYLNSPIFEKIDLNDDEDFDDYMQEDAVEDKDNDIMVQMTDFNIKDDVRAQRILALQEFYKGKNVFPPEDLVNTECIDDKGAFGRTKLHVAVINRDLHEIVILLDSGANTKIADNNGFTPYQTAVLEEFNDVIELFVEKGILE